MKKNLITVIILALVVVNLVLTAVLTFTIVPQTKKSNELINTICTAINLDLEAGKEISDTPEVSPDKIEVYDITDAFTVNLKSNGDGNHYAVFKVGLSLNTESKSYKTYGGAEGLQTKETIIRNEINSLVAGYTVEEFNANNYQDVKDAILSNLQELFEGPDFIIAVNFSEVNVQ
uniref:flagellar basal body-associated FliL family protein n=1 Tax=Roseburia sp. TaxID=2049040 RepID=UPI003FEEC428